MELTDLLQINLQTYTNATNITVTLLDKNGDQLAQYGPSYQFCSLFAEATGKYCPCHKNHQDSCLQAISLGEAYIYLCPGGLIHFIVSLFKDNSYQGSILAGPIALDYPDMTQVDSLIQKYNIGLDYRRKMYTALTAIPLIEPFQARHLSKLLFLLISNLMTGDRQRREEMHEKTLQQAKIGEYIRLTKEQNSYSASQYSMEQHLIQDVLSGNSEGAKALLNDMLGQIYFTSGNNIEIIKVRTIELIALLSHAVYETGMEDATVYDMTQSFMKQLTDIKDLTDLSYVLMETLECFTNMAFSHANSNNLSLIKKSIAYIHDCYNQGISLTTVANHVNLNPAYFSFLFKKEMGMNFSAYLLQIRVENARLLLKNSTLSLSSIALELGFESQSYFSKVFKKATGITPKQYRQQL